MLCSLQHIPFLEQLRFHRRFSKRKYKFLTEYWYVIPSQFSFSFNNMFLIFTHDLASVCDFTIVSLVTPMSFYSSKQHLMNFKLKFQVKVCIDTLAPCLRCTVFYAEWEDIKFLGILSITSLSSLSPIMTTN